MYERPLHGSQGVFEIEVDGTEHHHRTHESGRDPIDSFVFIHDLLRCLRDLFTSSNGVSLHTRPDRTQECDIASESASGSTPALHTELVFSKPREKTTLR